jgi:hypothetical protein
MEKFELGNTGLDPIVKTPNDANTARFGHLNVIVDAITALQETPPGSGLQSVVAGTNVTIDDSDPLNPIINSDGAVGDYLPLVGGTMDEGATINFNNGARLQQGTTDADIGGNGGIALRCSVDYELKWEAGRLYVMQQDGSTIREVRYTGLAEPTEFDDVTKGFVEGSRWVLDNGITYVCPDPTEDAAVWELIPGPEDFVPLAGTPKGGITGNVSVNTELGGSISAVYPNGDGIVLGAVLDIGTSIYSAISFFDGTIDETVKLYIRGGDLSLINENTEEGISGLIGTIDGLSQTKVNFADDFNTAGQGAYGTSNYLYVGENGKQYLDNGINSFLGYTKLPSHYFIDSCSYTQILTSAPTVVTTFETQVGDYADNGVVSKSIDYIAVGHYRISYNASLFQVDPYLPTDLSKVKVILSPGKIAGTILSYDVDFTAVGRLSVDIFVRQSTTGNLVNGFLAGSVIDVYFYR